MSDTKLTDLTALTTPSGDDILYVVDDPAGTPLDRKLALDNLFTRGTVTVSSPVIDAAQTWNAGGVTFTGLKFNATDTASAAGSLLMDLQVGGVSRFRFRKDGLAFFTNDIYLQNSAQTTNYALLSSTGFTQSSTQFIAWGNTNTNITGADTILTRRGERNLRFGAADAATALAQTLSVQSVVAGTTNVAGANLTITGSQGTGTGVGGSIIFQVAPAGSSGTAQNALVNLLEVTSTRRLSFYNTFTDATTFERANIFWDSNVLKIGTEKGSVGGNARALEFQTDGTTRLTLPTTGAATFISGVVASFYQLTNGSTLANIGSTNGAFLMTNSAVNDFNRLVFGGTTSSFPALKRSSASLIVRLADDTANAALESASLKTDAPTGGTSGTWKLGVAATVSPTSPNRTIEVDIGGTIYYLSAKTTND